MLDKKSRVFCTVASANWMHAGINLWVKERVGRGSEGGSIEGGSLRVCGENIHVKSKMSLFSCHSFLLQHQYLFVLFAVVVIF